jgi:hypothetical protein
MGQRHQAFVIARLRARGSSDAKYRCIAVIHHQWCYGRLPLRAAHRMLELVRQPDNAQIVRLEVAAAHDQYGLPDDLPEMPDAPCPFVLLLLRQAFSVDLTPGSIYASNTSAEPAGMSCYGGGTHIPHICSRGSR